MHGSTSESSVCDFVLLELLTLVASRNTTGSIIAVPTLRCEMLVVIEGQNYPDYCLPLSSPVFPVFLHTNKVSSSILMRCLPAY